MAVNVGFTCAGVTLTEAVALDFGTVQAGSTSAIKTVIATNTGTSDAQQCVLEPKAASIANGFASELQVGTATDTYLCQTFSVSSSGTYYNYAVLGTGKVYGTKVGGTIANTNGTDTFFTKWTPPITGISGAKVWGNVFSCVYV